jgi:hypothetical protein
MPANRNRNRPPVTTVPAGGEVPAGMTRRPDGRLVPTQAPPARGGGGGGGSSARPQGEQPAPTQPGRDMLTDVYNQGRNQLNNSNYNTGSGYIQNTLGSTNFQGQNDYLANLGNQVGNANFEEPLDRLRTFLGSGTGGINGGRQGGGNVTYRSYDPTGGSVGGVNVSGSQSSSGGVVPDTVGDLDTFFARQMRALFDPSTLDPANDPTMQPYLDALKREANEAYMQSLGDLDARAEGSGRYGSGMYNRQRVLSNEEYNEALQGQIAQQLFGARESAMGRRMEGLGMTNQRDLAAMQDKTQRYGIDAQANAARDAGSSMSSAMSEAQEKQMELQAIGMLMGHQQFGLSALGDVGSRLQAGQLGALGAIPGLEGANQGYLSAMLGGAQGVSQQGMHQQDLANRLQAARIGNQVGMANLNFQRQMYNDPLNQMGQFLDIYGRLGQMGGAQWGQGPPPNMVPNGPSPWAAGLGGAVGGGMAGWGMQQGGNP